MDFTVSQSELLREIQHVQSIVERKTTVPILSNLLLETSGNSLQITATDLDVSVRCSCKAEVRLAGSVTVSARKLFDIVRLLPDHEIVVKASSAEWVNLTCQRSRFKIAAMSRENFPEIPSDDISLVELPAEPLVYMISRCVFAITTEESRYTLNGAQMVLEGDGMTFVTTDGHRLALIRHQCSLVLPEGEVRVLVPKKAMVELSKLGGGAPVVHFGCTSNHLFFRIGERLLVSRVLSGQFPSYDRVIPRENNLHIPVRTVELADAIRRVAVMADDQSRSIRLTLRENLLEVTAANPDFGEAREALTIRYAGESLEIGFNAHYLLDFLTAVNSEEVSLRLKDKETQALLKPVGQEDFEYSYVVMPIKI
jgi:DNA polymerase III subunit beta